MKQKSQRKRLVSRYNGIFVLLFTENTINDRVMRITVPEDIIPCRLDVYLVQQGIGLSRNQIQKLIRSGGIKVLGKGTKPNFILRGGEIIEIELPKEEPFKLLAEDIPLDIVYEDEHLIVVNKPPGMVTHPAKGNWSGTLINAVLGHTKKLSPIGGDYRPGVVHRLDKDTSGLVIVAKRAPVHLKLSEMLSRREINREYIALIWGHLPGEEFIVDAPLGRHPKDPLKKAVVVGGKPAKSLFIRIASFEFLELVRVKLFTGRTHQIRVHAQHIGNPVFGDPDYGGRESRLGGIPPQYRSKAEELLKITPRQMLHAWMIEFIHPATGEKIRLKADIPPDFANVLRMLRGDEWKILIPDE